MKENVPTAQAHETRFFEVAADDVETKERAATMDKAEGCGGSRNGFLLRWLGPLLFLLPVWAVCPECALGSVAVLVEQPYGHLGTFQPGGHSAVYLDHVCAATPVQLRPCLPGELGVVISRYDGIQHLDWIAMPLMAYFYAVDSAAEIPLTMDKPREIALRDAYRRAHLESLAPDLPNGNAPPGNWYELVGSAYDRTIYGFSVKSTPEQDEALIALFNDRKNVERYNGFFRNCADFVRVTVNRLYPHAIKRNLIADFGVTSPKHIAKDLNKYAAEHPELDLHVFVIPQVEGSLPRSHSNEGVSEALVRRYGLPMLLVSPITAGIMAAAYLGDGRFQMPKHAPPMEVALLEAKAEIMPAVRAPMDDPEQKAPVRRNVLMGEAAPALDPPPMPRVTPATDSPDSRPPLFGRIDGSR